jgi:hypothetical protein
VIHLAQGQFGYFSFLQDSKAAITVIQGDGRLSLQRELDNGGARTYDLLVLDAFSSDSIPIHLITDEAFRLYVSLLSDDGVLAFHTSNRYLDIERVLERLALEHDYPFVLWRYQPPAPEKSDEKGLVPSIWLLISRNEAFLSHPTMTKTVVRPGPDHRSFKVSRWTDDFHNLFELLDWKQLTRRDH